MTRAQEAVGLDTGHASDKVHALTVEEFVEGIIRRNGNGITTGVTLLRWVLAALNTLAGLIYNQKKINDSKGTVWEGKIMFLHQ